MVAIFGSSKARFSRRIIFAAGGTVQCKRGSQTNARVGAHWKDGETRGNRQIARMRLRNTAFLVLRLFALAPPSVLSAK
jgi:hypothetical protein